MFDNAVMREMLGQLRGFQKDNALGVRGVKIHNGEDDKPVLIQMDLIEHEIMRSRMLLVGDMQNQVAVKLTSFSKKLDKLPRDWGTKVDTSAEIVLSIAAGRGRNELIRRFNNCVSERFTAGPYRPMRELYRRTPLIRALIMQYMQEENKPRTMAWQTRDNDRFWAMLEPDESVEREYADIHLWHNPEF